MKVVGTPTNLEHRLAVRYSNDGVTWESATAAAAYSTTGGMHYGSWVETHYIEKRTFRSVCSAKTPLGPTFSSCKYCYP